MREYRTVKISDIDTGDRFIDPTDTELPDLVADIKANGLQTPILVDQHMGLIDGLRRMEAFKPDSEVDVCITDLYVDTLEIMLKDRKNPFTRHWTTRRVWDFHQACQRQRAENHHNAVRINLNHFKGETKPKLPKTVREVLNTRKKVSLSRDAMATLSGYTGSAIQTVTYLYSRALGQHPELDEEAVALASDLVKRMEQGYNIYSAKADWNKVFHPNQPRISSESEQRQILRNAAISSSATGKILADVTKINDDITVEEATAWLRSFVQARADFFTISKKLKERIGRG